jgi:lysozyme
MRTSINGIRFIEHNEGFRSSVYRDNTKSAIGYGHDLLPGESFPNGITPQQAANLLIQDLSTKFEPPVNRLAPEANQNQFDALVDFCYNLGPPALATMLHHGLAQVPTQIPAWCYEDVKGVEVKNPDLESRRQSEVQLFNTPVTG